MSNILTTFSDLAHQYTGRGYYAFRDGYDGAPDADDLMGNGSTPDEAIDDLLRQENDS